MIFTYFFPLYLSMLWGLRAAHGTVDSSSRLFSTSVWPKQLSVYLA